MEALLAEDLLGGVENLGPAYVLPERAPLGTPTRLRGARFGHAATMGFMADRQETPKEGTERIRWMPATNGGLATYIQFGPHDRKGYRGDFVTIRELRGGELRFDGYGRPQWPSSRA